PERFPRGTIILLAIIALILIGSGFGFILYATTTQYRTSLHQQATSVPQSTGQAQKTALARNQATANAMATANGNIYATSTAQAGATATLTAQVANATATAGTFGDIFTNATSGTPTLDDPLSDNSSNNKWDVTNGTVGSGCIFT